MHRSALPFVSVKNVLNDAQLFWRRLLEGGAWKGPWKRGGGGPSRPRKDVACLAVQQHAGAEWGQDCIGLGGAE